MGDESGGDQARGAPRGSGPASPATRTAPGRGEPALPGRGCPSRGGEDLSDRRWAGPRRGAARRLPARRPNRRAAAADGRHRRRGRRRRPHPAHRPGDRRRRWRRRTLAEAFDHMLDRLDDAFSRQRQFVSDASHELRTPLTAIRGQLEVLARERAPRAPRRCGGSRASPLTEMARIERLVDDLLTLARLDEGAPLQLREIALAPFLRRLAEDEPPGRSRSASWPRGSLRADPDRLTQVIRNLLANARRHAGPGGRVAISGRGARRAADDPRRRRRPGHHRPASASGSSTASTAARRRGPRLRRQRPRPGDRPLDRRAARRPDLGRGLAARRRQGRLRAGSGSEPQLGTA